MAPCSPKRQASLIQSLYQTNLVQLLQSRKLTEASHTLRLLRLCNISLSTSHSSPKLPQSTPHCASQPLHMLFPIPSLAKSSLSFRPHLQHHLLQGLSLIPQINLST